MASNQSNYQRLLSLTKLLTSHVNNARHEEALALFHHILSSPSLPIDPFVFPLALKSCAAIARPQLGFSIHAHCAKSSFLLNPYVTCALIGMYGKCLTISSARQLFDESPQRNVVVWNAMISLYTHSRNMPAAMQLFDRLNVVPNESTFNSIIAGFSEDGEEAYKALGMYRHMQSLGLKPNLITALALLRSSVGLAALNLIKEIHGYSIRNGIDPHVQLRSALVEAYGRCGCLSNAKYIFASMEERDVVSWSSLISAYALHGEARMALEVFKKMELAKVQPDGIAFLEVLKACSHAGLADEAKMYVARMRKDYGVNVGSDHYACLVDVLSRAGRLHEAYEVIMAMPMKATAKAWGALLGACQTFGEVELAKLAGQALSEIEPGNAANYVILARIYASAGRHEEAEKMRNQMAERGVKVEPGSSWI